MTMQKFATAAVLEARPASAGLMRNAHRAAFDYVSKPGMIYVRSRAISSRCNDNFDEFPAAEIAKAYRTFIGKPVFVNHNNENHRRARGVILDAALHEDMNPDGSPDTWVEVLHEVDGASFPLLAKGILDGDIDRTSMGTDVAYSLCSACGNKAVTPLDYCNHIRHSKGQKLRRRNASTGQQEDVLIREVCYGLGFFENSLLVEEPADPTAFFLGVEEHGQKVAKIAAAPAHKLIVQGKGEGVWGECSCGSFVWLGTYEMPKGKLAKLRAAFAIHAAQCPACQHYTHRSNPAVRCDCTAEGCTCAERQWEVTGSRHTAVLGPTFEVSQVLRYLDGHSEQNTFSWDAATADAMFNKLRFAAQTTFSITEGGWTAIINGNPSEELHVERQGRTASRTAARKGLTPDDMEMLMEAVREDLPIRVMYQRGLYHMFREGKVVGGSEGRLFLSDDPGQVILWRDINAIYWPDEHAPVTAKTLESPYGRNAGIDRGAGGRNPGPHGEGSLGGRQRQHDDRGPAGVQLHLASTYTLSVDTGAQADYRKLDGSVRSRVLRRVKNLKQDPFSGATSLSGLSNVYRVRVADDLRIVYRVSGSHITVLLVADRGEIYSSRYRSRFGHVSKLAAMTGNLWQSSTGVVHKSLQCGQITSDSKLKVVPTDDVSEAGVVAEHGHKACTFCYRSAPVGGGQRMAKVAGSLSDAPPAGWTLARAASVSVERYRVTGLERFKVSPR